MAKLLLILESDVTRVLLTEALVGHEVVTCRAEETAQVLALFRPDALILDLFLPGIDGLALLENCRGLLPPVVLALSVLVTDYVQQKVSQLGGFVIPKPCTIDHIVIRLTDMLLFQTDPQLPDRADLIDQLLNRFRLRAKPRLLSALRAGILIAVKDPESLLTKEIYPEISKVYHGSKEAVDQAIRRALRKAWKKRAENPVIWDTLFPGYTECPDNGDFISTLARYLRTNFPTRFT